jgi:hypothetical protein
LGYVSVAFQLSHFRTDGRRANIEKLGQQSAADRTGDLGVLFDDGVQDFLLALGHNASILQFLALCRQEC